MNRQPNVLFLFSDQHNAKVLGHAGHPDVRTPNLDALTADGVRFTNAVTQNPICTPSRVSFLSGQYCHNHGYYGLSGPNPGGLPSVLGHFRRAGYRTSAVGKIHCPEYWVEDDADNFHETCGGCSIVGMSKKYMEFLEARGKLQLEDHGSLTEFGKRGTQSMEGRPSPLSFEESQEGWIAAETIDFMERSRAEGKPFFAFASFPRPHQCTAPSEEFWSLYEGVDLTLPPNADYDMAAAGKAPHAIRSAAQWRKGEWALIEPKTFEAARLRKLRGYLAAISQTDHAVGKTLDYLDRAGIADDTIVIYSTDHGDYACEHGIMEKAPGICADAITRIPFIWRWNGHFKKGHRADELAESVDAANTLCDLAGLPRMETSDGGSLAALLAGGHEIVHDIAVTEFAWSKSVRKEKYRLVWYPKAMFAKEYPDGFGELYDIESDPWEMKNLWFDGAYRAVVSEMERNLTDWLVTTARPKSVWPPSYRHPSQAHERYKINVNADGKMPWKHINSIAGGNYT
ncbi:MAG: sulfatase-like hydrolase/transferase [Spirochaetes bacterium]|nr:sulfatase-like hydrolase/transferase [Spirochaetota bacterium]